MLLGSAVEVEITPRVGTQMEGYSARTEVSLGIHDPLMASLLLFDLNGQRMLWISLDTLAISLPVTQQLRQAINKTVGIDEQYILINASHTHSGPVGYMGRVSVIRHEPDPKMVAELSDRLCRAATDALSKLQPVSLWVGCTEVEGLGHNRNNPKDELQDKQLLVLIMKDSQNESLAKWVNYGCHPTVMGFENRFISADFPGAARKALKELHPNIVFAFANGASGDISTRYTRCGQDFDEVDRTGRMLAAAAQKAVAASCLLAVPEMHSLIKKVEFPLRDFISKEAAQAKAQKLMDAWHTLQTQNSDKGTLRKAQTRAEGALAQVQMVDKYKGESSLRSEMQVCSLGDFKLVSIPGEPFTQTVLNIKASRPGQPTAVVSYANDYLGYFPDKKAIREETYEALVSPFSENNADLLAEKAISLLKEI